MYLWRGKALVLGVDADSSPHAHHALQLTVALEGEFRLSIDGGDPQCCRSAMLWPGQRHKIAANGALMAHLFIDPGHRSLASWQQARHGSLTLSDEIQTALRALWQTSCTLDDAEVTLLSWQQAWLPGFDRSLIDDPRIANALLALSQDNALDAHALAKASGLSLSRFSHLFSHHTNLPFRRYVLWMRLLAALDQLAAGANLTTAAHAVGFADLAHMSRIFHATFGVVPSTLSRVTICR